MNVPIHPCRRAKVLQHRSIIASGLISVAVFLISLPLFDGVQLAARDPSQLQEPPAVSQSSPESICPPSIGYGETIQCSTEVPGEVDAYDLAANEGDVILARMNSGQCCDTRRISLYEPGGGLVLSELGYKRVEITSTISASGDYVLSVGFEGGMGDYDLHLQRLNGPVNAVPIAYGETITGTVDLGSEFKAHTFSADSGDLILARMHSGQCCNGREIRLYGPDGHLLLSEVGYTRVEITQTIPIAGEYTLLTGFEGGSSGSLTGDYNLYLQRLNGPGDAVPIAYGQTITGTVDLASEYQAHTFSADSGDLILARMHSGQCCNGREIRLYGPDGHLLLSEVGYTRVEITQTIPIAGEYTLLTGFEGGSGGSLTGDYNLYLQRLNGPGDAVPIIHGQTLAGAIDFASEFDAYTFPAYAGDEILSRMSSSQCCNYREIRLYGSEGELLASELGYASVELGQLFSTAGEYLLLVSFDGGSGGSLTGGYDLSLTCLVLPCKAQFSYETYLPAIFSITVDKSDAEE